MRAAGAEPPLLKRCKCGADVSSLSEYHLRKHCQGQKHKSLLSLSQLRPISSYFAPQATAGLTSAAVCYNIPGPASASCSSEALLVYSSDCDDDDCAREPGDCYYDGVTADISGYEYSYQ